MPENINPEIKDIEYFIKKVGPGGDIGVIGVTGIFLPAEPIWLEATLAAPELVERFFDCKLKYEKKMMEIQAKLGVQVYWAGGDMADKNGPMYSPRVFRQILLPRLKELCDYCHSLGGYYLFRSDGNLWAVSSDLFDKSGIDGYGEIDYDSGMRIKEVRDKFPKLALWGNVSCGSTLYSGTKQQIIDVVKENIAATGGIGLIAGCSNSVLPGTPVENLMVLHETAKNSKI
ncbi:MAG: hypothetical protein A3J83_01395 [Elusimicrobia bacterium RIFOXYA2_FULL_40_6]|nr:MAG: hypothetical protein A3J83_01395 [Elusimicrobia bacterium RIFOXYA2_FULL_40_6]